MKRSFQNCNLQEKQNDKEAKTSYLKNYHKIIKENLELDYFILYNNTKANKIFNELEKNVTYYTGDLARVKVYGKWHKIPRKQVAFGNKGLSYHFSGNIVPATPWEELPLLLNIKNDIEKLLENRYCFNFVLINRYENGMDHMGEHRDDEKELVPDVPIASLSLGQPRDFIFKHKDNRGKCKLRTDLDNVNIVLGNGSLLVMNPPTNNFWYHSLPVRKNIKLPRINLTFRTLSK